MDNLKNKFPSKIKITESQYKRIFSGDIQIIGDEFAYKNPAQLNEQLMGWINDASNWLDKNIGDPISDAADFVSDGIVNGANDIGNTVANAATELYNYTNNNSGTEVMNDILGIVDQGTKPMRDNIDHNWEWWVKYDWPYIKKDIKRAFNEIPDALWVEGGNFKRMYDLFTDVETYKAISEGFKIMFNTLADPEEYKKVPEGVGMLWDEISGWPKELWDWLKTWTLEDWIDLAAIICFCIPYPPLWVVGFGLEGTNVAISLYKGKYSEAGLRALFLFGGALLSKAVSNSYKISADAIEEGTKTVVKVAKVAEDSGIPAARTKLAELTKGADAETKKFVTDVFERVSGGQGKKNFAGFDNVKHQMSEIKTLADKYIAEGISEARAINRATKETVGEDIYNKYFRHLAAESKVERVLLSGISGVALTLKFKNFLRAQGMEKKIAQYEKLKEEQVEEIVNSIDGISKKSEELQKEAILLAAQNWEAEAQKEILELQESYPEIDVNSDDFDQQFIDAMTKPKTKLNEEIYRMKELFSNKRLYGNLIT